MRSVTGFPKSRMSCRRIRSIADNLSMVRFTSDCTFPSFLNWKNACAATMRTVQEEKRTKTSTMGRQAWGRVIPSFCTLDWRVVRSVGLLLQGEMAARSMPLSMDCRPTKAQDVTTAGRKPGGLVAQSERLMCPVAVRRSRGLLALTQRDVFLFGHGKLDRLEPGSLMRSVTKWLVPRTATRTPIVGSRLKRHHGWFLGCNAWVSHE